MEGRQTTTTDANGLKRRRFLGGAAVAGTMLTAGCMGLTESSAEATEIHIPAADADALGYSELVRDHATVTEGGSRFGLDVSATVTNRYAIYEGAPRTDDEGNERPGLVVGAMTTPRINILFDQQNPLAGMGGRRLLYDERTHWLRDPMGLGDVDREWTDRATRLGNESVQLLGERGVIQLRGGHLETDAGNEVLFVYYTKVQIDDGAAFFVASRRLPADGDDRPLIGEDGYLTEAELAADFTAVGAAFGAFRLD